MLNKIKTVILNQLIQGATPRGLALSIAFAVALGTFPTFGTTTLLCLIFGVLLKLNQPLMQTINYIITPIHLLMLPVFLKIGEKIVGAEPVSLNPKTLYQEMIHDFVGFCTHYGWAALHAILAWSLMAPLAGLLIYFVSCTLIKKFSNRSNI